MQYLCSLTTLPHVSFMNYFAPKGEWMHFRRRNVEYIMYYIAEGEMYIQENGTEYVLLPGDVFFLQPYLEHVGTRPAKCAYYFAHFSNLPLLPFDYGEGTALEIADHELAEDTVDSVFDFEHCMLPKHIRIRDEAVRAQIVSLFEEGIEKGRSGVKNFRVLWACKLLEILTTLAQNSVDAKTEAISSALPSRTMNKMGELTEYLETHYAEKITGSAIEAEIGMNFDYLNRTFRKVTGKTVFQYLNRVRINRVKELLKTTDMKLAEIAALTGFSDEFYLSRQFKKATGVSPVLYSRGQIKN